MGPEISFENLSESDLYVDCVYKGGNKGNAGDDPLHLLMECDVSGGFRKRRREDNPDKLAYVILYTSMTELEWPDYLDEETGIFRYYGDNRTPGKALTDTKRKGNRILENVFTILNSKNDLDEIPPFFIFKKTGHGRDVKFLGLAAPGNPSVSPDNDLVAFWRTLKGDRFQNYEAYFTILDTGAKPIPHEWLNELITYHKKAMENAPSVWKKFIQEGREGIKPLKAPKQFAIPDKFEQLQSDEEGRTCLDIIRKHYEPFPQGFEACATNIVQKINHNFTDFNLTRPWRDGGRDAIGRYIIDSGKVNQSLKMECALEAKCYSENNSVGVKEMSRLISRIRYRQFGILVTTSYVNKQAYEEVVEDEHPILIVTAADIAAALRKSSIYSGNVIEWLSEIDANNKMWTYSTIL